MTANVSNQKAFVPFVLDGARVSKQKAFVPIIVSASAAARRRQAMVGGF